MAKVDLTRAYYNNSKSYYSVSVGTFKPAELKVADGVAADGTLAIDDEVTLFKLPAGVIVTRSYILVRSAAAETTAKLQVKIGGAGQGTATAVGNTAGAVIANSANALYTGTGAVVTCAVSVAALKSGEFNVVVEYVEADRQNGEFTNV